MLCSSEISRHKFLHTFCMSVVHFWPVLFIAEFHNARCFALFIMQYCFSLFLLNLYCSLITVMRTWRRILIALYLVCWTDWRKRRRENFLKRWILLFKYVCAFVGQQTRSLEGLHCKTMVQLASSHVWFIKLHMTVILSILAKTKFL